MSQCVNRCRGGKFLVVMRPARNILDDLSQTGLSLAQLTLVAELMAATAAEAARGPEETKEARAKRLAAERQARKRAGDSVTKRDSSVTGQEGTNTEDSVTERDIVTESHADTRAHVGDINPTSEDTCVGGGVGSASERDQSDDWPAGDHARQLVEAAASPWLDPNKSQNLIISAGLIESWRRRGASWTKHVVPVVVHLAKQHHEPINHWKFFQPAIARAVAASRAEMELPDVVVPFRQTGPPSSRDEKISASWDYALEKIARDEQS